VSKLGTLIKFIPYPVVNRFHEWHRDHHHQHANPRFLRAARQIAAGFYRQTGHARGKFSNRIGPPSFSQHSRTLAIWFWPQKIGRHVPGSIVIVILAAIASVFFHFNEKFEIQTLGTAFGEMPRSLPLPLLCS